MQDLNVQEQGYEKALKEAEARIRAQKSPMTLTLKARIIKHGDSAIQTLKEALALDENYVWAYLGTAYVILKEKRSFDYEMARNHLEQALQHSYRFSEARRLLIENLHRLGEYEEEMNQYEIHLNLCYFDMDARYNFADLLRTQFREYEEALEQIEVILAHQPDHYDAQLLQAVVLCQAGEFGSAESLYLFLADEHPNALLNLALLYKDRLNQPEKALKYFQAYLAYTGPNAEEKTFLDEKIMVPTYIERLQEQLK